jgi:predicted membrane GTPase involved in stress response
MMAIIICNTSFSQDTKKVNEKIIELEKRILVLENKIDEISKQPLLVNSSLTKTFNIKYEIDSEDKNTEFLIAYWDKDGQPRGAWARSGWKLAFSTTDINQNIQIQGKPFAKDTKKLTVKIYVNDKLIKSESKELKFTSIEGPYCQVILSEL